MGVGVFRQELTIALLLLLLHGNRRDIFKKR